MNSNRLLEKKDTVEYFEKKLGNLLIYPKAACIGMTYSGTKNLRQYLQSSPNIVDIRKYDNLFNKINEYNCNIPFPIINIQYLSRMYMLGNFYTQDQDIQALLTSALYWESINKEKIPLQGSLVPVLFDTYGFTGTNFIEANAFNEPWYYDNKTIFFVSMRTSSDAVYAAFKNTYDSRFFGKKFEDTINFDFIKQIVTSNNYPSFEQIILNTHYLFKWGFHKKALEMWINKFPAKNFYIIPNTEIENNNTQVFNTISDLLDIPYFQPKLAGYKAMSNPVFNFPAMNPDTREVLDQFFDHYNSGLMDLVFKCNVIGDPSTLLKRIPLAKPSPTLVTANTHSENEFTSLLDRITESGNILAKDTGLDLFKISIRLELYGYSARIIELFSSTWNETSIKESRTALLRKLAANMDMHGFHEKQFLKHIYDTTLSGLLLSFGISRPSDQYINKFTAKAISELENNADLDSKLVLLAYTSTSLKKYSKAEEYLSKVTHKNTAFVYYLIILLGCCTAKDQVIHSITSDDSFDIKNFTIACFMAAHKEKHLEAQIIQKLIEKIVPEYPKKNITQRETARLDNETKRIMRYQFREFYYSVFLKKFCRNPQDLQLSFAGYCQES